MKYAVHRNYLPILSVLALLAGCATTESLVARPTVTLKTVELQKIGINNQTFLLGFEVQNPNAFPLPIESIRYRILFDGEQFAGGETPANFSIPADGRGDFSMTVETDFLGSVDQITTLLRRGVPDHVEYEMQGSLSVDIPLVRPLTFSNSGVIPIDNDPY